jgi:glycosyltransferase involved in cell wall biosynthesis
MRNARFGEASELASAVLASAANAPRHFTADLRRFAVEQGRPALLSAVDSTLGKLVPVSAAVALLETGRSTEARVLLERHIEEFHHDSEYLALLSRAYRVEGLVEHALWYADRAHVAQAVLSPQVAALESMLIEAGGDPRAVWALGADAGELHIVARLLIRILDRCPAQSADTPPGRLMLATSSLGAGGAERQLAMMCRGLKSDHPDLSVTVVAANLTGRERGDFYLDDVRRSGCAVTDMSARRAPVRRPWRIRKDVWNCLAMLPARLREDIARYCDVILRLRPDVVQAWQDGTVIRAGVAAVLCGVPRLRLAFRSMPVETRGLGHPYFKPVLETLAARPNVLCSNNSHAGAAAYGPYLGIPKEDIRVIQNGIADLDEPALSSELLAKLVDWRGRGADERVLGSVMRLDENKRPILWLDIASRLPGNVLFLIVGDGPAAVSAKEHAKRLGIADRVFFTGYCAAPRRLMQMMDAFMLVSRVEGLPNTIMESQWEGVPVIAANTGGVSEVAAPNASLLIDEAEFESLDSVALKVARFVQDKDALRVHGVEAAKYVRDNFSLSGKVAETLAWFRE